MIDMSPALVALTERVIPLMHDLNGVDMTDTEDGKEKAEVRSHKAEVSRRLLELADTLSLIECLVRNEYWWAKGRGFDIGVGL